MDPARQVSLSDRAAEVQAMQLAIGLEIASYVPGTFEYEFTLRRGFARQLAAVLSHTVQSSLIHGQFLSREELPYSRVFTQELAKMRLHSDHESIHEIDRMLHKTITHVMSTIETWAEWSERTYAREYREKREAELATEREQKLMRRRIARVEKVLSAKPVKVVKRKKKPRDSRPLCEKCHKRPVVKDSLCEPCYGWEKNKLGRA